MHITELKVTSLNYFVSKDIQFNSHIVMLTGSPADFNTDVKLSGKWCGAVSDEFTAWVFSFRSVIAV